MQHVSHAPNAAPSRESSMAVGGKKNVDEWVELTNGCLCCSVKDDFVNALESLMLQQSAFDYILIETTGLANPGPVASALWTDEELEAGVCANYPVYSMLELWSQWHWAWQHRTLS